MKRGNLNILNNFGFKKEKAGSSTSCEGKNMQLTSIRKIGLFHYQTRQLHKRGTLSDLRSRIYRHRTWYNLPSLRDTGILDFQ